MAIVLNIECCGQCKHWEPPENGYWRGAGRCKVHHGMETWAFQRCTPDHDRFDDIYDGK